MKGASGLGASITQGYARVTVETLGRPLRMREPQSRHPELNARLVKVRHHAQLLRRGYKAETLDLLGVDFDVHGEGMLPYGLAKLWNDRAVRATRAQRNRATGQAHQDHRNQAAISDPFDRPAGAG